MFCFFPTGSLKSKTKRSRFLNGLVYKTEDISVKIEDVLEESKNDINVDDTEKYHNDNSSSNNDDQKTKNDFINDGDMENESESYSMSGNNQKSKNDNNVDDIENDSDDSSECDDIKSKNDTIKSNDLIYNDDSDTSTSDDDVSKSSSEFMKKDNAKTKLNFIICELCGLEYSKKKHGNNMMNSWKYHMYIKHLKNPIDNAIEQSSKSFSQYCPIENCDFRAKTPDKRLVALHYIGVKHPDVLKKLVKDIKRNSAVADDLDNENFVKSEIQLHEKSKVKKEFATEKEAHGILKSLQIRLVRLKEENLTKEQELQIKQETIPKISSDVEKFEIEMNDFRENNFTKKSLKTVNKNSIFSVKYEDKDQSTPKRKRPRPKCKVEQSEKNDDESPRIPKRLKTEKDHDINQKIMVENNTKTDESSDQIDEKKKKFSCDSCGKLYRNLFSVQQHFKKDHKGSALAYSKIQAANNDEIIKMDTNTEILDEEMKSHDLDDVTMESEMNDAAKNLCGNDNFKESPDKKFVKSKTTTTVKITLARADGPDLGFDQDKFMFEIPKQHLKIKLSDIKNAVPFKGSYRYYFKNVESFFIEVQDDSTNLPIFEDTIVAKFMSA